MSPSRPILAVLLLAVPLVSAGPVPAADLVFDLRGQGVGLDAEFRDVPLREVLQDLTDRASVKLVLRDGVDGDKRIDLVRKDLNVGTALNVLARAHCLGYRVPRRGKLVVESWSDLCDRPAFESYTPGVDVPARRYTEPFHYPEGPWAAGYQGRLMMRVTLTRYGLVDSVSLVRCDVHQYQSGVERSDAEVCAQFYTSAAETMRRWRFEPPRREQQPVEAELLIQVAFLIP